MLNLNYDPAQVLNLPTILRYQRVKIENLREKVKELKFTPLEPSGTYSPITFKSFDGGMFKLHFDPFEFDIVEVADSNGNSKLRFAAPKGDTLGNDELESVLAGLNESPIIRSFLSLLQKTTLSQISEIIKSRGTLMEIAEFACIFEKVISSSEEERTIILKDGLLRTKKIKAELIRPLRQTLFEKKNHVKLIGISKTSRIVSLVSAAVLCEKVFPEGQIGYVEVPLELENMAYRWSGKGKLDHQQIKPLDYAFGSLYIAKLSRSRNLLVTVEIPKDLDHDRPIYSKEEIIEIMNYVAKDSLYSYPIMGYPQTIMRAHEFAVRLGIPASIFRDRIINDLINDTDPILAEYIRDGNMLRESVDKGSLGGRA